MADNALQPRLFTRSARHGILLDVRTPTEYAQGHIPNAQNFPLFTDAERAEIGTLYQQVGQTAAIDRGLEIAGPQLADWVHQVRSQFPDRELYLHCWRGGMRSGNMAWLFQTAGFVCFTLRGGYKAYRQMVLADLAKPRPYRVLGGFTGSGKTTILHLLREKGQQIIDLEGLANHKGSAFGALGLQPTSEQFANNLQEQLQGLDPAKPVWVEDESRLIGKVYLPEELVENMRQSPLLFVQIPQRKRVDYLVREYGKADTQELKQAFEQIRKRLGGQFEQQAQDALDNGDLAAAAAIALRYYDRAYLFGMKKHVKEHVTMISYDEMDWEHIADDLIDNYTTR